MNFIGICDVNKALPPIDNRTGRYDTTVHSYTIGRVPVDSVVVV